MKITETLLLDGRKSVTLPDGVLGPITRNTLSVASLRRAVNGFVKSGRSTHSGNRMLLSSLIAYCEENSISYRVTAVFSKEGGRAGYYIERAVDL